MLGAFVYLLPCFFQLFGFKSKDYKVFISFLNFDGVFIFLRQIGLILNYVSKFSFNFSFTLCNLYCNRENVEVPQICSSPTLFSRELISLLKCELSFWEIAFSYISSYISDNCVVIA